LKIILDITKLVESGEITSELAEKLKKLSAKETGSLGINILIVFGVVAFCLGVGLLAPKAITAFLLSATLAIFGVVIKRHHNERWGPLGSAALMIGAIVIPPSLFRLYPEIFGDGPAIFLVSTAIFLILGVIGKSGFLVTLSALSTASWLGGSTGYTHASYGLVIREPTITIVVFAALAVGALFISKRLPAVYERIALIYARVSLVLVNFGFWVGSLWGDTPGESWLKPEIFASPDQILDFDLNAVPEQALHISAPAFSGVWALALLAVGIWGVRENRRFVVNTAAVFGSILLYTRYFDYFQFEPFTIMTAGALAIGIGLGFWRYNQFATVQAENLD
tara:strand:+ start:174 stop:1184 length:1011 start_codon:yes stop_codon:yes gene_type:complete